MKVAGASATVAVAFASVYRLVLPQRTSDEAAADQLCGQAHGDLVGNEEDAGLFTGVGLNDIVEQFPYWVLVPLDCLGAMAFVGSLVSRFCGRTDATEVRSVSIVHPLDEQLDDVLTNSAPSPSPDSLREFESQSAELRRLLDETRENLNAGQSDLAAAKAELAKERGQLQKHQADVAELRRQLEQSRAQQAGTVGQQAQVRELRDQRRRLEEQLMQAKEGQQLAERYHRELLELRGENQELREKVRGGELRDATFAASSSSLAPDRLRALESESIELRRSLGEARQRLEVATAEHAEERAQFQKDQEDGAELRGHLEQSRSLQDERRRQLEEQLTQARERFNTSQLDLAAAKAELAKERGQLQQDQADVTELRRQLEKSRAQQADQRRELEEQLVQAKQGQELAERDHKELLELRDENRELREKAIAERAELAKERGQLQKDQAAVTESRKQLEQSRAQQSDQLCKLEEQLAKAKAGQQLVEQDHKELLELRDENRDPERFNVSLVDLAAAKAELAKQRGQLQKEQADTTDLRRQLEQSRAHHATQRRELEVQLVQAKQGQQLDERDDRELLELRGENLELREKVVLHDAALASIAPSPDLDRLRDLEAETIELRRSLQEARERFDTSQSGLAEAKAELTRKRGRLQQDQADATELRKQLEQSRAHQAEQRRELEGQLAQALEEQQQLEQQLAQERQQLAERDHEELLELRNENRALKGEISAEREKKERRPGSPRHFAANAPEAPGPPEERQNSNAIMRAKMALRRAKVETPRAGA